MAADPEAATPMSPDRFIRRLNGPRGAALLFVGGLCALHALAYSPFTEPPARLPFGLEVASAIVPMQVYGALWVVAAVACWAAMVTDRTGHGRIHLTRLGWGLFVGLSTTWGTGYLIGWVLYLSQVPDIPGSPRSYLNGGVYLCVAGAAAAVARMRNPPPPYPQRRRRRRSAKGGAS